MALARRHLAIGTATAAIVAFVSLFAAHWEGLRTQPYRDIGGVATVCDGHTGNVQERPYTLAECQALLHGDVEVANRIVHRCIPNPMPAPIEAALTDAAFNLGPRVVCGSTLQKDALQSDWRGVCDELQRWDHAGGTVVRGLERRRSAERDLCLAGVPQ